MFKKLLLILLVANLYVMPEAVYAHGDSDMPVEIEEETTPENPKRDKNNNAWFYLASFIALGAGIFFVKEKSQHHGLKLNVDSIESNNDGSYIVSFGYDNPDNTIAFNENECGIKVLKGKAIILKKPETNEFKTGQHKDELIAVINEDSEIEYYAGSNKISIKGRDIAEKEENENA